MVASTQLRDAESFPQELPSWFRQSVPNASIIHDLKKQFLDKDLHTVCQSARCPNMGQCWQRGVATFMILGDVCTRSCRFCAVSTGRPLSLDQAEPENVASAVKQLGLRYCVVTSVTRDDLDDFGAKHFALTIKAIKQKNPGIKVEVLVPDFCGSQDCIRTVLEAGPDVFAHNIEMAQSIFSVFRPQADYSRSLDVLRMAKDIDSQMIVKSGLMVGLGETDEDVTATMKDLYETGCRILTIGQYLAPSQSGRHVRVKRFVHPEMFERYRKEGEAIGFGHVFSAPLVRSSYLAEEAYQKFLERKTV